MDTDRIDILHITDRNRGVICVSHDFIFYFLIALNALFNKNLMNRRQRQSVFEHDSAFRFIIGKAAAGAAERECRAKDYGISDLFSYSQTVLKVVAYIGREHGLAETFAKLLEQFPVLRSFDSLKTRAEYLNITLFEHTFFSKLNSKVKTCLSAERRKYGIGPLVADDPCHIFKGKRLHIHFIGYLRIRHDRCGIGIDKHDLIALFFQ